MDRRNYKVTSLLKIRITMAVDSTAKTCSLNFYHNVFGPKTGCWEIIFQRQQPPRATRALTSHKDVLSKDSSSSSCMTDKTETFLWVKWICKKSAFSKRRGDKRAPIWRYISAEWESLPGTLFQILADRHFIWNWNWICSKPLLISLG